MRDVVQKVIATESEARGIVETARAEADRILSEARKKGQDTVEQARQAAFAEAGRIVETAVAEAEREKQGLLVQAAAEIERDIRLNEADSEWAIEGVIGCVCGLP